MKALLAAFVFASPVAAQEIDFDVLFEQNAARVQTPSPGTYVLELPGPVIVTCRDGQGCTGQDQSAHGAAGCALRVITEMAVVAQACPDALSAQERERLQVSLSQAWSFWAQNTVPKQSPEARDAARDAALTEVTVHLQGRCPLDDSAQGLSRRQMLRSVTRETIAGRMARVFETPRLPVTNPCF